LEGIFGKLAANLYPTMPPSSADGYKFNFLMLCFPALFSFVHLLTKKELD
jgi:hypothetical protein